MRHLQALLLLTLLVSWPAFSQIGGIFPLHGSLESNSLYDFEQDSPYRGFHSNNYLKLDYTPGKFSAGLQGEWYPSPMPGYDTGLKGWSLPVKYVSWTDSNWSVRAGDFFEQIGNGILLRSWEDRSLGLRNGIGGLLVKGCLPAQGLSLTLLSGVPSSTMSKWGYSNSLVSAADLSLTLPFGLSLGGAVLHRYEWAPEEDLTLLLGREAPRSVIMHSVRAGFSAGAFQVNAEYVGKSPDFTAVRQNGASDTYSLERGMALYADVSWSIGSLSLSASGRYLDNMAMRAYRTLGRVVPSNTLNYLPALCQQQTYMLACLNPYETLTEGEWGLRGDAYYHFARGSYLGGKYGMTFHVGGSWINGLAKVLPRRDRDHLAYRDLNIELSRKWTRSLITKLFVSIQENSPTHGNRNATEAQNVFVLEGQYNFSRTVSLRTELQYLYSQERERDWMAALVEFGIAPNWSFTVSDMYNHGSSREHYWNVSASWTKDTFKCILGYGRNREGMVCSGGVCRWQPEYTGLFLRLQYAL